LRHDLALIDVLTMSGLEVGLLAQPRVRKDEGRVKYLDHPTAAELREKYPTNATMIELALLDKIVDVDYVPSKDCSQSTSDTRPTTHLGAGPAIPETERRRRQCTPTWGRSRSRSDEIVSTPSNR